VSPHFDATLTTKIHFIFLYELIWTSWPSIFFAERSKKFLTVLTIDFFTFSIRNYY